MATVQFKDTTFGKAVRTFNQVLIVVLPITLGVLALPEVQTYIAENISWLLPLLAPAVAIATYLYNYLQNRFGQSG